MTSTDIEYCEHDEIAVACLDCMAKPQKVAPRPKPKQKATKSPASENDLIAPLSGSFDMSIPTENAGLIVGSDSVNAHAFPHDLRRSGWVYLRDAESLCARAKAKKVEWRNNRAVGDDDPGPGMVITVDPASWDSELSIDLGWLASRQVHGYRYLLADEEGQVVHYSGGKPVKKSEPSDEESQADEQV